MNTLQFSTTLTDVIWDIEAELAQQCPLMTKMAWAAHQQERRAFACFRRGQLAGMVMPTSPAGADWEQVRAVGLRRAYLETQIKRAWLARAETGTAKAAPRQA